MSTAQDKARAALRVLDSLGAAIYAADAETVLSLFVASDDVVMVGSEEAETAVGHADVSALWNRVLGRGQRYRWEWSDEKVLVRGGMACVFALARVTVEGKAPQADVAYRATLVLEETADGWRILSYHGSEPAEAW